ncbi:MAG TPA: HIRAN domain-containing protein [Allosphingosinicella sp.]
MSSYKVGLVGEQNYQPAIRQCRPGEKVYVVHEVGNPYDEEALAVESMRGMVIGYIPRSNWLRGAILTQGQGCEAIIASIERGTAEHLDVVLDVKLCDAELESRRYRPTA